MLRKLIFFILFIFFAIFMYGLSPSKLDSLQQQLKISSNKAEILLNIAYYYNDIKDTLNGDKYANWALEQSKKEKDYNIYTMSSFYKAVSLLNQNKKNDGLLLLKRALEYVKSSNDSLQITKCRYYFGRYLFYINNDREAEKIIKSTLPYLRKNDNKSKIYLDAVLLLFNIYQSTNNNDKAIKFILDNIDYAETQRNYHNLLKLKMALAEYYMGKELNDKVLSTDYEILSDSLLKPTVHDKGIIYLNTASVNLDRNTKFAEKNAKKALSIFTTLNDSSNLSISYNQLAIIYTNKKKYDLSLEYYNKALKLNYDLKYLYGVSLTYNNIGEIYRETKKFDEAISFYKKAIEAYKKNSIKDDDLLAILYLNIATVNFSQNRYKTSLKTLNKIKSLNESEILKATKIDIYKLYSDIYAKNKNFTQAYLFIKKYLKLKNEVFSSSRENNLNRLQFQLESLNMENELKILKKDKKISELLMQKTKYKKNFYLAILVLLFIILFIFIFAYRTKYKTNKALKAANEQIKDMNKHLQELSRIDTLTGLSNRRDIIEKANYEMIRAERNNTPLAITICDIDFFKKINDTYGHNCGDSVLKKLSQIFRSFFRKQDLVARWGGEEFLVIMPETDELSAYIAIEKIRKLIEISSFKCAEKEFQVTMTFGISEVQKGKLLDTVIEEADKALYAGKNSGRNTTIIHSKLN